MTDTPTPALADGPATALSTDKLEALRTAITPGPWQVTNLPGDWGLAGALVVTAEPHDPYSPICSCEYVTPYCSGSSKSEREAVGTAIANAEALALVPDLIRQALADRARIEALEGALQFYADISKYPAPFTGGAGDLYFDCGQVARAALAPATPTDGGSDAQ